AVLPDVRIDTHADSVPTPVWQLFGAVVQRFPHADVILERDDDLPPYEQLVSELEESRKRHGEAVNAPASPAAEPAVVAQSTAPECSDWAAIQRAFWPRAIDPDERASSDDVSGLLDESRPVPAARGARVYSDSYLAKLRDALTTNFPSLARVLGAV